MLIRLATLSDIPAIMVLVRKVVPPMQAAGNFQWNDRYPNDAVFARDIELDQLWVAEQDGTVVGVTAITAEPDHEYAQAGLDLSEPALAIHRLAVDPDIHRAGIGRRLMAHAEDLARSRNIDVVRVDTSFENQVTQRLFPSLGYRLAGEIKLEARPGLRVLCYEKRLREVSTTAPAEAPAEGS